MTTSTEPSELYTCDVWAALAAPVVRFMITPLGTNRPPLKLTLDVFGRAPDG